MNYFGGYCIWRIYISDSVVERTTPAKNKCSHIRYGERGKSNFPEIFTFIVLFARTSYRASRVLRIPRGKNLYHRVFGACVARALCALQSSERLPRAREGGKETMCARGFLRCIDKNFRGNCEESCCVAKHTSALGSIGAI